MVGAMDALVLAVVVVAVMGLWSMAIVALVSAARLPAHAWKVAKRSKAGTIVGIVLTGGFGGVLYWFKIRPRVADAARRISLPPRNDAWSTSGEW